VKCNLLVSFQCFMTSLKQEGEMPLSVKGKCHLMIFLLGDLLCE
jgi:hypothetical protein